MVKILLHGCNGRMGQVMTRIITEFQQRESVQVAPGTGSTNDSHKTSELKIICGVDLDPNKIENSYPVYPSLDQVPAGKNPDILIDFSHHNCIAGLLDFGIARQTPLVICTTGYTAGEQQLIKEASHKVPVLMSANMSLGINLLLALVAKAATVLGESFDIEIVEKHHNQKVDSPSGTAMMIAEAINTSLGHGMEYIYGRHGRDAKVSKRKKNEIGIHAVRGGAIVGEHDIIFAGQGEVIEIRHSALSRDVFAYGAIKAARFLAGKESGLYSMKDVVEAGS
ncbi:MAG: 4-hydroxy-tetrahydrodipicolinate reductase [Bacillota bacterium]